MQLGTGTGTEIGTGTDIVPKHLVYGNKALRDFFVPCFRSLQGPIRVRVRVMTLPSQLTESSVQGGMDDGGVGVGVGHTVLARRHSRCRGMG